jgi:hypothetical protein
MTTGKTDALSGAGGHWMNFTIFRITALRKPSRDGKTTTKECTATTGSSLQTTACRLLPTALPGK